MQRPTPSPPMPAFPAAAALAALLTACASGAPPFPQQVLDSRVRAPAIQVDGGRVEWEGNLTRVGDRDVFAGFHRRGDTLFMALVSQDPGFDARVFGSGLTVWFDTAGTRRSGAYGIRYPVIGPAARQRIRSDTAGGRPDRERLLRAAGSDFVLVRDSDDGTELSPAEAEGLRVAASIDRGLFTWEARIPLGSGPHALPAAGADTISVGLRAGGEQGAADGRAATDSAGRGGGRRGPPGRFGRPGPGQIPPLELWVRVNLEQDGGG